MQEQLDAINEEIRWVILNSAPQKLGFSEELSSPRSSTVWLHFQDGEDYRVARQGPRHLKSSICLHPRNPFQNVRLKSGGRCQCLPCGSPRLGMLVRVPEALKVKGRTSLPSMDQPCMWQP